MSFGSDSFQHWQLPEHVPPELFLDIDPWQNLGSCPHDTIASHAQGQSMRYVKQHPMPGLAPNGRAMRSVLIDNKAFASRGTTGVGPLIGEDLTMAPLELDPPEHARMRKILHPFFQPASIERYRARVRALAESLIDACLAKPGCDFLKDFAEKLPTTIFLELMGLPQNRLPQFMAWEEAILHGPTPAEMVVAWSELRTYLTDEIAARRRDPRDDLMSVIVTADTETGPLSDIETLGMCMLLFVAGLDTVVMSLSWQFRHLADNPLQQEELRQDPARIPAAVEEFLRAFSISTATRIAVSDTEVAGIQVRAGDIVTCSTTVGSRDPVDFVSPGAVDFNRGAKRHLAFGFGPHVCLGMHLARMEMIEAIEMWLKKAPPFRLPDGYVVPCHGGLTLGVDELRLEWDRSTPPVRAAA